MATFRGSTGRVLPHGVLLAVDDHDFAVAIASANTQAVLGLPIDRVLGAPLAEILAQPDRARLAADVVESPFAAVTRGGVQLDAAVHRTNGLVVLELEPAGARVGMVRLERAIERLQRAERVSEISRISVDEIRELTGFERVALYRHRGGIVELAAASPDTAPAEVLSLAPGEVVRFIADRSADVVPLVCMVERPLDLSRCTLREAHSDAKVGAELVFRLGDWGTLVCEHPTARHVPYSARAAAAVLARVLAWHLGVRDQLGDELRASNLAKDEFLATVSHELRTPLNAMLGWLSLITAGQVPSERQPQALATVTRNAHVLAQLVEELLDVSRVVSGKLRIDLQPVLVAPIIEAALATVQPGADAKHLGLRAHVDAATPAVLADAGRLQQVVYNLLTNAIKFTPDGGTVDVRLRQVGAAVEIEVADTGTGIEAALLPHVFERFRQGEDPTTRVQGLGLGLAIVRHLVELHGGDVHVRSDGKDRGATFTVRLPIATGRAASAGCAVPAPPAFEPAPQLRGLRVLAVDDEPDANDLVRAVLSTCGVEVTSALSADEALALLPSLEPHVLISDIGMPSVDGYGLIQRVRELPEHAGGRVPAIAVTAFARIHDRSRAFLAGFDVYLAKPIDPAELVAVLCNLAGRRTSTRLKAAEPPAAGVLAGARILIVDDDRDNAEMLGALLAFEGAVISTAGSAAEGMARIQAFRPDVLVSDIGLPDKDGFSFVRELRAMGADEGGWIPAIALSGHADAEHAREAILAGFQLHVAKPIDPPDLVARLARLVGRTMRRT